MYATLKKLITTSAMALSFNAFAETTIDFWSFTRSVEPFIKDFNNNNPDITVNLTIVPFAQYPQKIITALRSPKTAPTVFVSHINSMNQFVKQNIWMPLDDVEGFNNQRDNFFPYAWDAGLNDKGQLVAATWQANPIAFFYNRKIAKKYLGTDDYQEVSQKMNNFDNMLNIIRQLKEQSGQSYYIFWGSPALAAMMQAKYQQPLVSGSKLTAGDMIDELFGLFIEFAKEEAIIYPKTDDALFKAIEQGKVFGIYTAPWFLGSKLKTYRPEDTGNWGLAASPYPAIRGGTWVGISKMEKDKEKIQAAEKLMTDLMTNVKTVQKFVVARGDVPTHKIVYENIKDNADAYLNNQPLFSPLAQDLNAAKLFITPYDAQIQAAMEMVLEKIILNPDDWTAQKAVKEYKKQVALALPDIIVK